MKGLFVYMLIVCISIVFVAAMYVKSMAHESRPNPYSKMGHEIAQEVFTVEGVEGNELLYKGMEPSAETDVFIASNEPIILEGVKFRRTDEGQVIYAYSGAAMPDLCNGEAYNVIIKPRVPE